MLQFICWLVSQYVVAYNMIKKENNSMNYLNCKKCDMAVVCDEEATSITCSLCSMIDVEVEVDNG